MKDEIENILQRIVQCIEKSGFQVTSSLEMVLRENYGDWEISYTIWPIGQYRGKSWTAYFRGTPQTLMVSIRNHDTHDNAEKDPSLWFKGEGYLESALEYIGEECDKIKEGLK